MTVNRRTALAGMTAAGAVLSVRETAARVGGGSGSGSPLGGWDTDAHGLPVYGFTGDLPVETLTPSGHPYPLDPDPVFLLGNDYLTLFAFASGRLLFMSGEHGWVRLNEPARTAPGHAATLTVTENGATRTFDMIGMRGVCASGRQATRSFGCGTAHYRLTPQPGLVVERILSLAPTVAARRDGAAVIVTIRMTNVGLTPLGIDHVETVLSNPAIGSRHAGR
ncbi:hypothetical protein [Sphingomonas sp.]|uniref:hypothetical protein n=1 Tax=Sphingomonas sp. TaxID=28214 RepID=UPI003CC5EDE2